MDEFSVPEEMKGLPSENEIAEGPFVMLHNGVTEMGSNMYRYGPDEIGIWNGSRVYPIDNSYTITSDDETITLHSERYHSFFILRPVTLDDAAWFLPEGTEAPTDLEEFKQTVLDILADG